MESILAIRGKNTAGGVDKSAVAKQFSSKALTSYHPLYFGSPPGLRCPIFTYKYGSYQVYANLERINSRSKKDNIGG